MTNLTLSSTDADLFAALKGELFTAVVGDVLDAMGHRHQFLPAGIAPLVPRSKIVGRAMPVLEADVYSDVAAEGAGPLARKPFGLMLEALDDLKPGEIYIATGASLRYALWGGLMSTRATHLQAAGAILDGYVRDAEEIEALGFTVFCRGLYAQDQGPARQGDRLPLPDRDRRRAHRTGRLAVRRSRRRARDTACRRGGGDPPSAREGEHRGRRCKGDPERHERLRGARDLRRDVAPVQARSFCRSMTRETMP
jgi:hypothetical protein